MSQDKNIIKKRAQTVIIFWGWIMSLVTVAGYAPAQAAEITLTIPDERFRYCLMELTKWFHLGYSDDDEVLLRRAVDKAIEVITRVSPSQWHLKTLAQLGGTITLRYDKEEGWEPINP